MKVNTGIYIARPKLLCVYRLALSFGVEARRGSEKGGGQLLLLLFRWLWCQWQSAGMKESLGTAWPLLQGLSSPSVYISPVVCSVVLCWGNGGDCFAAAPQSITQNFSVLGSWGIRISQQRLSPSLPPPSLSLSLCGTVLIQFGQHTANTHTLSQSLDGHLY
jgi:hypothetical protein